MAVEMTAYANVPPHRARWMETVVDDDGRIDWLGVEIITERLPVSIFLDLEEVSTVLRDRAKAWEEFLRKNPDLLDPPKNAQPNPADFLPGAKPTFTPRPKK